MPSSVGGIGPVTPKATKVGRQPIRPTTTAISGTSSSWPDGPPALLALSPGARTRPRLENGATALTAARVLLGPGDGEATRAMVANALYEAERWNDALPRYQELAAQQPDKVDREAVKRTLPMGQVSVDVVKGGLDVPDREANDLAVIATESVGGRPALA